MNNVTLNEDIYYISDSDSKKPFFVNIAGVTYPDPSYKISRPNSSVMTIEYIIDGSGEIICDGKKLSIQKDDIYLLPPYLDHIYYSSAENPLHKIWFNISGPLVKAVVEAYSFDKPMVIKETKTLDIFEEIVSICSSTLSREEINDCVEILFHKLIIKINRFLENNSSKLSKEVEVMKKYIETHLNENVSCEKLASIIYKSKSQAIRIFKLEMGKTPYDYLLDRRFVQAKLLLKSTNLLIKEIAFRCGFNDEHYFSDIFKRKCGTTPREYRNKKE